MKYCPTCGRKVFVTDCTPDVATDHYKYKCFDGHKWEESVLKSGESLHITEITEEEDNDESGTT
jgi:hypothetical protein